MELDWESIGLCVGIMREMEEGGMKGGIGKGQKQKA